MQCSRCTFKNNFVAGLCTTDKTFLLHLWDKLIPQAILMLNLMHGSRINPNLSAWAQVHGNYDFNKTPIVPPEIKVLIHKKPSNRTTWAPHAIKGWYVGPTLHAYQCYQTWIRETKRECMEDTLTWFPTTSSMPTIYAQDIMASAIHDILHALQNPSTGSPLATSMDMETETLKQLATILYNKTTETVLQLHLTCKHQKMLHHF